MGKFDTMADSVIEKTGNALFLSKDPFTLAQKIQGPLNKLITRTLNNPQPFSRKKETHQEILPTDKQTLEFIQNYIARLLTEKAVTDKQLSPKRIYKLFFAARNLSAPIKNQVLTILDSLIINMKADHQSKIN